MALSYPVGVEVDPPALQNRLSVLLRVIYALPHLIIVNLLAEIVQILSLLAWFAILFTGKYPSAFAGFSEGVYRWWARSSGFAALLTDKYPPFSLDANDSYPVRGLVSTDSGPRNRLTCFLRLILAIPHAIAIAILVAIAFVVVIIAWITALVTGTVPAGLHNFLAGVIRWTGRYQAYVWLLRDEYPPFSLS